MAKSNGTYESKQTDASGLIAYSAEEDAVWHDLYKRQVDLLPNRVSHEFLDGLDKLGLTQDKVPQLRDVNARLAECSGFGVEAVPALITPTTFFTLLANRKFPIATFIRRREDFDYLEEPDIFHEIFGHCPLLTHPVYADFLEKFGKTALSFDKSYVWRMQKLFWFTVEFGLIKTHEGPRVYGAGIASSPGETVYAVESREPERRDFDLLSIFRTPYRIDIFQPIYYCIEDFNQLLAVLDQDLQAIMDEAKRLGAFEPTFPPVEKHAAE
ncbi:phenylalanine 4-monooxygenase [Curvivirga sp.]|uniref:phenylalanine 4-monooxygenase n=1 Tax=Curvivirga sp. TaxID=2856848 RepID=UPI003B5B2D26